MFRNIRMRWVRQELALYRRWISTWTSTILLLGAGVHHCLCPCPRYFVNKYCPPGEIQKKCPWYWNLKALIDECPNMVPVSTGNNDSSYNISLLAPSSNTSESGGMMA